MRRNGCPRERPPPSRLMPRRGGVHGNEFFKINDDNFRETSEVYEGTSTHLALLLPLAQLYAEDRSTLLITAFADETHWGYAGKNNLFQPL